MEGKEGGWVRRGVEGGEEGGGRGWRVRRVEGGGGG